MLRQARKTTERDLEALVRSRLLELSRQAGLVWVYQHLEAGADALAGPRRASTVCNAAGGGTATRSAAW